jgi:hypothetical protein
MHSRILAERSDAAQKAIVEAAKRIATAAPDDIITEGMLASLEARERDPAVTAMLRLEGVAAILSVLADGIEAAKTAGDDEAAAEEPPLLLPEREGGVESGAVGGDAAATDIVTEASADQPTDGTSTAPSPLPDTFPFRDVLVASGAETLEDLRQLSREDLLSIDTIGPARADLIEQALASLTTT